MSDCKFCEWSHDDPDPGDDIGWLGYKLEKTNHLLEHLILQRSGGTPTTCRVCGKTLGLMSLDDVRKHLDSHMEVVAPGG